ncbi:MAG: MarR family winged helix-turn-helix transcriptional regulator [Lachnospiraceae bacterium]
MTHDVGMLIKLINDRLKASADADLKERNLTLSQVRVLGFIHSCNGQTTQKDIEDFLGVAHPTVVGIISRLEKNGFLTCYFAPDNKRCKIVCNTKKATALSNFMSDQMKHTEEMLTKNLSTTEVHELCRMLEIIYHNIS